MAEIVEDMSDYNARLEAHWAQKKWQLKSGPSVVFLGYLGQHISADELIDLQSDIKQIGFELSALDRSSAPNASISSTTADLILALTEQITLVALLSGTVNNGVYDGVKALIVKCWTLVRNKRTISMTSRTVTERQAQFNLILKINDHQSIELKTDNLEDHNIASAIDHIGKAVKSLGCETHSLLLYDPAAGKWSPVEVNIDYLKQPEKVIRVLPLEDYLEELRKKETF